MAVTFKHQKIYFDTCCYLRLFDRQTQKRIVCEANAILQIKQLIKAHGWEWIGSDLCEKEVHRKAERNKRYKPALKIAKNEVNTTILSKKVSNRGWDLQTKLHFSHDDALHIACAEYGGADVVLTTDDEMLEIANNNSSHIKVTVKNPNQWLKDLV